MGQPRPGRRKTVVISSDEEDNDDVNVEDVLSDIDVGDNDTVITAEREVQPQSDLRSRTRDAAVRIATRSPAKSKAAPTASRTYKKGTSSQAIKAIEPQRTNKPIHSFFNAATQRQQSQQSVSPTKPRASQDNLKEDILDDISGDDTTVPFSKGSSIALAVRKRRFQDDQFDVPGDTMAPQATQKFRKISDGSKTCARPAVNDLRPWTEQYPPLDLSELAVHKKKVHDVRIALESALSSRAAPRLIVLKGPAGSAKTSTVNLLAKDLGAQIVEWKNPAGSEGSSGTYTSASAQFEDFILRSDQYAGLQLATSASGPETSTDPEVKDDTSQIMVVEEFPNTFARASTVLQSFRSTVQQFLSTPRYSTSKPTPLVMVISETLLSTSTAIADSFTAHRLLGPQILNHPQTAEIEFNPIATTILTRALDQIVVKEARKSGRRKTPGPQVLKHIAETGDIRSAISSLEFLCVKGDEGDLWSAKVAFTKPKGGKRDTPLTKQEQEALRLISNRESSLGIFHAVGKVVYNKRHEPEQPVTQPPTHLPQNRRPKIPEVDVDILINELGTDTSTFVAALHENYALSCNSTSSEEALDSLNGCIDALSDSDLLSLDRFGLGTRAYSGSAQDNLRQDDMSFQTAVRGLLFSLPSPVHRSEGGAGRRGDAFKMFYPASLKTWRRKEELDGVLDLVVQSLQSGTDTVGHGSRSLGRKEGVEGWRRGLDLGDADTNNVEEERSLLLSAIGSAAKPEILLDRLPYMAQILPRRPDTSSTLLSHISTLTSLQGDGSLTGDLDDLDMADDEVLEPPGPSEWTDRPDADNEPRWKKPPRKKSNRDDKRVEKEGGGLNIPVEHSVEKLVLSDDDIED